MEKDFLFHIRQKEGLLKRWRHHYIGIRAHKYNTAKKMMWKHCNITAQLLESFVRYKKR